MPDAGSFAPPSGDSPRSTSPATPPAPLPAPAMARPTPPPAGPTATWSVAPHAAYGNAVITDRREPDGAVVAIAWVVTVLTLGYMLPWAIAATRGKANQASIGIINLLLGWSLIGWIVALVMACQAHQVVRSAAPATIVVAQHVAGTAQPTAPAGWYPVPGGGQRYWNGTAWTDHHAP